MEHYLQYSIFNEKMYLIANLWKYDVRKSQKRLGPQIANPQSATFSEGPQI